MGEPTKGIMQAGPRAPKRRRAVLHSLRPGNAALWLPVVMLLKAAALLYLHDFNNIPSDQLFNRGGDTRSYFGPVERWLAGASYGGYGYPEGRMPGYGILYGALRLMGLSAFGAQNGLVVLQALLSVGAIYLFARAAGWLLGRPLGFYLVLGLLLGYYPLALWDLMMMTESFLISTLLLACFFYLRYELRSSYWGDLLAAGGFLAWMVFLKPVTLPLLAGFIGLRCCQLGWQPRRWLSYASLLLVPFLVAEAAWVGANWYRTGELFLLQSRFYYTPDQHFPAYPAAFAFVNAWGGRECFWDPSGDVAWFTGPSPRNRPFNSRWQHLPLPPYQQDIFPAYLYTEDFNFDSLKSIRHDLWRARDSSLGPAQRQAALQSALRKFRRYRHSFVDKRPFHYWVTASLHSLGTYLKFTFPAYPQQLTGWSDLRLAYVFLLHGAMLAGGLLGLLWLFFQRRPLGALLAGIAAYFTLAYPIALRLTQQRYLNPAYPFYLLGLAALLYLLVTWWQRRQTAAPPPPDSPAHETAGPS
jgi:hypothetical protein